MRYCYLTNELFPRDKGGIARLIRNIVLHQKKADPGTEITIVLPAAPAQQREMLSRAFENIAALVFARPWHEQNWGFAPLHKPGKAAPFEAAFSEALGSIGAMLEAERINAAPFDVIEVTDHGGLGAFVLRMRAAGQAFQTAKIICRLHSSFSIIAAHEEFEHARGLWAATRIDLERETVESADCCIAHLTSVADANQRHFGLGSAWRNKVIVTFPPCDVDDIGEAALPASAPTSPEFVFASRFQPFKRPELFVLGALAFLQAFPESPVKFRLISYAFDPLYVDRIRLMIPPNYRGQIIIQANATLQERDLAIANGIVVQPSSFESLCVFAYEVSAQMRRLLLPRDCVAFAQEPRWKDGENCLFFDPTPAGLAKVMAAALSWCPSAAVATTPDPHANLNSVRLAEPQNKLSLHLCILPHLGRLDAENMMAIAASGIGYAAFAHADQHLVGASDGNDSIQVFPAYQFAGAHLRDWAKSLGAACIVLAADGFVPSPEFLDAAQKTVRPGHVYSANCLSTESETPQLHAYPGKTAHASLGSNDICPPCVAVHISDLGQLIGPEDSRDLMERALARLTAGPLKLILAPLPTINCLKPPAPWARRRNLMGVGALSVAESAPLFRLGIELPNGQGGATLQVASANLIFRDQDAPALVDGSFELKAAAKPRALRIQIAHSALRRIVGMATALSAQAAGDVRISLHVGHNTEDAVSAHLKGLQCRKIMPGQQFQLRWGPFEGSLENFTLIIDGAKDTYLTLNDMQLLTRE